MKVWVIHYLDTDTGRWSTVLNDDARPIFFLIRDDAVTYAGRHREKWAFGRIRVRRVTASRSML